MIEKEIDSEAMRRQTIALEQIRDHYYPPPRRWWKRALFFTGKVICVIVAYLGIVEGIGFLVSRHESKSLAAQYAAVAQKLSLEEGDAAGAVSCYERCIELSGGSAEYRIALAFQRGLALGLTFFRQNRPPTVEERAYMDKILAEACVLVRLEPTKAMPHILMAQVLLARGEKDDAVEAVARAVALEPQNASVRVSSCAILFFAGYPKEARAHLVEAERLDPTLPLLICWKGCLALWADHDVASARTYFKTMTQRAPRQALGHAFLGKVCLEGDQPDVKTARKAFGRAIVLDSRQTIALVGMAESYEREGDFVLARLWLDRALATDKNCIQAMITRARVNDKGGDYPAAVRDLTAAIALAPFRADLYLLRAEAYDKAGEAAHAALDRKIAESIRCEAGAAGG